MGGAKQTSVVNYNKNSIHCKAHRCIDIIFFYTATNFDFHVKLKATCIINTWRLTLGHCTRTCIAAYVSCSLEGQSKMNIESLVLFNLSPIGLKISSGDGISSVSRCINSIANPLNLSSVMEECVQSFKRRLIT